MVRLDARDVMACGAVACFRGLLRSLVQLSILLGCTHRLSGRHTESVDAHGARRSSAGDDHSVILMMCDCRIDYLVV